MIEVPAREMFVNGEGQPAYVDEALTRRLQALRERFPDASVTADLVRFDERIAVVRAEIVTPGGGRASGLGAVDVGAPGAVERAENRALNRALGAFGIQTSGDAPIPVPVTPAGAPGEVATIEAVGHVPVAANHAEAALVDDSPVPPEPELDPDPPLEDYSWTAFWNWARKLGYQNKVAVEELIGQSITSLSPAQVRNLLRAKTGAE